MKKVLFIGIIALSALTIMSCGGNKQQGNDNYQDSTDVAITELPTLYGVAVNTTTGDTLRLLTDNGDTLTINIATARENMKLLGNIVEGERMIVQTNPQKTIAESVINQNMLLGDWVMPDPIDGSSEIGISIKEGGIAETIEQTSVTYRTWRIVDGQIEIVCIHEGGSQDEETNYYDIVKLTADSLTYKNDDDTFEYSRQKAHVGYGQEIELEESSFDKDFAM